MTRFVDRADRRRFLEVELTPFDWFGGARVRDQDGRQLFSASVTKSGSEIVILPIASVARAAPPAFEYVLLILSEVAYAANLLGGARICYMGAIEEMPAIQSLGLQHGGLRPDQLQALQLNGMTAHWNRQFVPPVAMGTLMGESVDIWHRAVPEVCRRWERVEAVPV